MNPLPENAGNDLSCFVLFCSSILMSVHNSRCEQSVYISFVVDYPHKAQLKPPGLLSAEFSLVKALCGGIRLSRVAAQNMRASL